MDNPCPIWDRVHNRTVLLYMSDGKRMLMTTSDDEGVTTTYALETASIGA